MHNTVKENSKHVKSEVISHMKGLSAVGSSSGLAVENLTLQIQTGTPRL